MYQARSTKYYTGCWSDLTVHVYRPGQLNTELDVGLILLYMYIGQGQINTVLDVGLILLYMFIGQGQLNTVLDVGLI